MNGVQSSLIRMSNIKQETINGAKWGLINKCVMQPANFLYFMVLARLITPGEMGVLGLTGIFFAVANSLKEAGFGTALIRKQNRTETDCSTVFWFNIAANVLVALIFWFVAPWFAVFFNVPDLKWITRVSCIMMVLGATQSVHYTLYTARRDFKTTTIISIITTLAGMPVTLYLAYAGWSYWSMVISGAFTGLLSLIIIWIVSPWKPRFLFSYKSFKEFFSFGFKLSLTGCVWQAYAHCVQFLIGRVYSPAQLALYDRGKHLSLLPSTMLFEPINNIMFPILSTIQDDEERLRQIYRKYVRLSTMPMVWILLTMVFSAHSIIYLFYGATWLPCAEYLQIICLGTIFSPLIRVNHSYLLVKGRSDLLLWREISVMVVSLLLLGAAVFISVKAVCWALALGNVYNFVVTLAFSIRLSKLSFWAQVRDFLPYVLMALLVNMPAWLLWWADVPYYICAFAGPGTAFILYLLALHLLRDTAWIMVRDMLQNSAPVRKIRARFSS